MAFFLLAFVAYHIAILCLLIKQSTCQKDILAQKNVFSAKKAEKMACLD